MLIDQHGNQCPLITGSYSPCQMEKGGQIPNWEECPFNNEKTRGAIAKVMIELRIAPNEFWPVGQRSWDGLPFQAWVRYVMDECVTRP